MNDTQSPFENRTWVKNAISSGALTPPPGEQGRRDYSVVWIGMFGLGCLLMFLFGVLWR